jgi:hypothetical protein
MKNFIVALFCLGALTTFAQKKKVAKEAHRYEDDVEILLDSAAARMIQFILVKDTSCYKVSMDYVKLAKTYNDSIKLDLKTKSIYKHLEPAVMDNEEEISAYYQKGLYHNVMVDNQKNIKINYRFKKYYVGPRRKEYFNTFIEFLPRN